MKNRLILLITAVCLCMQSICAETPAQVKGLAKGAKTNLPAGLKVRGVVVSDYLSYNNDLCPNIEWNRVDIARGLRTVYIQNEDGSAGIKLVLDNLYLNKFSRGSVVEAEVGGKVLVQDDGTFSYVVEGVTSISQVGVASLAQKCKKISELEDEDIYTFVTLTDLEFTSKQGSFMNVYEQCTQKSVVNAIEATFRACDGWASLLEDSEGNHIYMQMNSKVPWRRNKLDFPKGRGCMSGVLVSGSNRRYGRSYGPYSIRPLFREDIVMGLEDESVFTTVASWRWDRNYHGELVFDKAGAQRWLDRKSIKEDAVLAEKGNGLLYSTAGSFYSLDTEYDARHSTDCSGMGARTDGSLRLDGDTSDWYIWNGGNLAGVNSIIVELSTAGISGKGLIFNFSMLAGNHSARLSYGFPAHWVVTYSTDGARWRPTGFSFSLRPIAYQRSLYEKEFIPTSYDAAMGFPEFSIKLPASLLGQEKVYFRIAPADDCITALDKDPSADIECLRANSGFSHPYCIRIGMVEVKTY